MYMFINITSIVNTIVNTLIKITHCTYTVYTIYTRLVLFFYPSAFNATLLVNKVTKSLYILIICNNTYFNSLFIKVKMLK